MELETWLFYLSLIGTSIFKVMPAVLLGLGGGLNFVELAACTFIGGTIGCWFFTFFGDTIRKWWRQRMNRRRAPEKPPKTPNLRMQQLWERYGLLGCALLTPPFLSPPIGTALALSFGAQRRKILTAMTLSMAFWALIFGGLAALDLREQLLSLWN
jgi:hypothetical protein